MLSSQYLIYFYFILTYFNTSIAFISFFIFLQLFQPLFQLLYIISVPAGAFSLRRINDAHIERTGLSVGNLLLVYVCPALAVHKIKAEVADPVQIVLKYRLSPPCSASARPQAFHYSRT